MENQKIFVSYSRTDLDFAVKFTSDLKKAGADVWLDKLEIRLGEKWDNEIENALQACQSLFFIASKASVASDNVLNEVYFALEGGKKVYPIIKEECKIPFRLNRLQYLDLSNNYEQGLNQLLKSLGLNPLTGPLEAGTPAGSKEPQQINQPPKSTSTNQLSSTPVKPFLAPSREADTGPPGGSKSGGRKNLFIGIGILALVIIGFVVWKMTSSESKTSLATNNTQDTANKSDAVTPPVSLSVSAMNDSAKYYEQRNDFSAALAWYKRIAATGDARGMWKVGSIYQSGKGTAVNQDSAFAWFKQAADRGDAAAMDAVAECYKKGLGIKANASLAAEWLQKVEKLRPQETSDKGILRERLEKRRDK